MTFHIHHTIKQKTWKDVLIKKLIQTGLLLKLLPISILYSPILVYQWIRHKIQPNYSTILQIDDSRESVYGFTETWYNSACSKTPVRLIEQYFDVSKTSQDAKTINKFFVNFNVVRISSKPENEVLNDMLFSPQSFKFDKGVILQSINPNNESWELVYYDLITNKQMTIEKFSSYFELDYSSTIKNGVLILKGDSGKQKIKIKISTDNKKQS